MSDEARLAEEWLSGEGLALVGAHLQDSNVILAARSWAYAEGSFPSQPLPGATLGSHAF